MSMPSIGRAPHAVESSDAPPVRARGVVKRYGTRPAVSDVELDVGAGDIVALVGPNGSGKTTLLRMLAGLVRPDDGDIRLFGLDPVRDRARLMQHASFSFAPPALFPGLTAREHLVHLAAIGQSQRWSNGPSRKTDVEDALALVGLLERADDRVRTFSFGMRQRLALALSLVPRPELVVLDEPTDGLDPLAVLELRAILRRLRDEHGVAILLASHLLVEVDELVDRMLVLSNGRPLFSGPPRELMRNASRLEIRADDPARAQALLASAGHETDLLASDPSTASPSAAVLATNATTLTLEDARALLAAGGVRLTDFHRRAGTLEEALIARLREERSR